MSKTKKALAFVGLGSAAGYGTVAVTGMTAAGMVGSGAGIGAAAGPVGVVAGAGVGLALYGLSALFD